MVICADLFMVPNFTVLQSEVREIQKVFVATEVLSWGHPSPNN
jgi:hypothetical protein